MGAPHLLAAVPWHRGVSLSTEPPQGSALVSRSGLVGWAMVAPPRASPVPSGWACSHWSSRSGM